jgi:hypothetical protein
MIKDIAIVFYDNCFNQFNINVILVILIQFSIYETTSINKFFIYVKSK